MKTYRATIQFTAPVTDETVDVTKMEAYIDVMAESEKHARLQLAAMGVASEVVFEHRGVSFIADPDAHVNIKPDEVSEDVITLCIEKVGP